MYHCLDVTKSLEKPQRDWKFTSTAKLKTKSSVVSHLYMIKNLHH